MIVFAMKAANKYLFNTHFTHRDLIVKMGKYFILLI